jgi:hypothetical protein
LRTFRLGRSLQPETGEGIEHDPGKSVEVADQEGEEADVKRFLDEMGDDVLVRAPGPDRPASVTSMTISVEARNATSPPSRPKPESMYRVKTSVKRSMTPVFIADPH